MVRYLYFVVLFIFIINRIDAQNNGFTFDVKVSDLQIQLNEAKEKYEHEGESPVIISLPNHLGKYLKFEVFKSSVLSKENPLRS